MVLVGCVLPWWAIGGAEGLPALSGNAFDGMGMVVFIVALATIALVTLPYATELPITADRWPAYTILAVVGWAALAVRIADLAALRALVFREPVDVVTNGPGLWVAAIGLAMLARSAFNIWREPRR